ncbi:S8 family peptidase [Mongoliitalea daihaiensis]|uniref:S8 family peptidase n=1 Tax=Mongoliitalea daihaiensis TaxID=2782006 RepID=UPI001F16CC29|nr:S8 family peptidase [Mongoliitalea daihaiensis]UJP63781.1 S8 family peptidase [Mongoliitalea daihaiensis]
MFTKKYAQWPTKWGAFLLGLVFLAASCQEKQEDRSMILDADMASIDKLEGPIPGKYIVVLHEETLNFRKSDNYELVQAGMREVASGILSRYDVADEAVDVVFGNLMPGFAVSLTDNQVALLKNDPAVHYIEQDGYVHAYSTTQTNATWGLDRIDQRSLPLNGTYTYTSTGQGVTAYIIDTGIRTDHVEFGGRAQRGFDAFGGNSEDCNGHGTHVAGTVGGTTYGVAKNVTLVGVRVLDCRGSGSFSGVIAGMDWVAAQANGPTVANMSLGGGSSTSVNDAVARMYDAGVPVIVAAGNSNANACNASPAGAPRAYTVGSTVNNDTRSSFSNFGNCVDIFAPGSSITAAWHTSSTAINTISGTSMASPHVAGVAALFLQGSPSASAQAVYNFLTETSTKNVVTNSSSVNNHMLYSLGSGSTTPDPEPEPENPTPDPEPEPEEPADGIQLSGSGTKVQGRWRASLSWSGAASAQVDIFRNGTKIATVSNSGSYTDQTNFRGGGSLTYTVCEAGSNNCSSAVTINF